MSVTGKVTLWHPVSVTTVEITLLFSDISKGTYQANYKVHQIK